MPKEFSNHSSNSNQPPEPNDISSRFDSSSIFNQTTDSIEFKESVSPIPQQFDETPAGQNVDPLVGQTLDGRFFVLKNLQAGNTGADKGGIGIVYLAQDLKLIGRYVVIKVLQDASLSDPNLVRKFGHEKEALSRLDHPGIVNVLDSGTLRDGKPYLVMQYIEGQSLRRFMNEHGALPLDYCVHIIRSVTDALAAVHSVGILHRDIKPENIMLTPQSEQIDRVRLIDFGIARVFDSKVAPVTDIEQGIGTVLYVAPEQLLGKLKQSAATDIYPCGVMFYEMLTGERPFKPQTIYEMTQLQKEGVKVSPRTLRPELSFEAEQLILQALSYECEERPQNIRKFGMDLANLLLQTNLDSDLTDNYSKRNPDILTKHTGKIVQPSDFERPLTTIANLPSIRESTKDEAPVEIEKELFSNPHSTNLKEINETKKYHRQVLWLGAAGAIIVSLLLIIMGVYFQKDLIFRRNDSSDKTEVAGPVTSKENAAPEKLQNKLSYLIQVKKLGNPFEDQVRATEREIFENGDQFQLEIVSSSNGYFYLFNQDKDDKGQTLYRILYPRPAQNNGSSRITADQQLPTGFYTLPKVKGTEIVWLIWTRELRINLDSVQQNAFDNLGKVKGQKATLDLQSFLENTSFNYPAVNKDEANKLTDLIGHGDTIVHKLELEHR